MAEDKARGGYLPQSVEERWAKRWVDEGVYAAAGEGGEPFSIVIPPPNVTGVLHIGHALDNTIQDIIARFQRMAGRDVLWLPGCDHAGIATQVVVERNLANEGLDRRELGREAFLERVWDWKHKSHAVITSQLKRLGCSVDWGRERFTLDEELSKAVRKTFCDLYDEGLIYRGRRIVNWCPNDRTALSDEEVEHEEHASHLWHIRYPLTDGEGFIEVATTRPETMLGDTGVAVNPEDERYQGLVGKTVMLPLMDRPIPIVADERVQLGFGTGAVKVTPAHDPLDFELGLTHNLEQILVIGLGGAMTEQAGPYAGLSREECRERVLADLKERGALAEIEDYEHSVGHCQRCHTVIEPLVSAQWFLKMQPLAQVAIQAAKSGEGPRWRPERWEKVYLDWLEKLGDWCISRQLWWGHRIPVWKCLDCGHQDAFREDPTQCPKCQSERFVQDEDVLDTWFSSGLWPFSTMGWPDTEAADYKRFFPTSVLVTGYDIIFFWVVRMVTMSLKMTGKVPFETVYIHGLVRDEQGRKISKSLGNTVDPVEIMEEYGADSLRFALTSLVTGGQDISFGESRLVGARNFCNKIYNATQFAKMNLEGFEPTGAPDLASQDFEGRWILSRTARAIHRVTEALTRMEFSVAADAAYHFWWSEFCDWYIEMSKVRIYGADSEDASADAKAARERARQNLHWVLSAGLRLLHPIMPYITEELWSELNGSAGYIGRAAWPEAHESWFDEAVEARMDACQAITRAIRTLRSEKGIAPSARVRVAVRPSGETASAALADADDLIRSLARLDDLTVLAADAPNPEKTLAAMSEEGSEIFLFAEGAIDLDKERARLQKEIEGAEKRLDGVRAKLGNEAFTGRAPADVVEREREREKEIAETLERLRATLAEMG